MSDQGDWEPPDDEADLPTVVRPSAIGPDPMKEPGMLPGGPEAPGAPMGAPMGRAPEAFGAAPQAPYGPHGQPAQGQPAQGQPAQGQPAQGQPAQGQPAQGQAPYGHAPQAAYGQAPQGQMPPGVGVAPKKKSYTGIIAAGCGGCLLIVLSLCCVSGIIFYFEEGVSSASPGSELASYPIAASGGRVNVESVWEGTGYAHVKVYLDLGEAAPDTTRVTGRFGCNEYGRTDYRELAESNVQFDDVPDGWILLSESYGLYQRDGERISCDGDLTIEPAAPGARIVLTERQRPSDWLSEWF
jgi:hypothetical protein